MSVIDTKQLKLKTTKRRFKPNEKYTQSVKEANKRIAEYNSQSAKAIIESVRCLVRK